MKEIKEKPKDGKPKQKTKSGVLPKQTARMMKEKYIRELEQRPKGETNENEAAADHVEQVTHWAMNAAVDLTSDRITRQRQRYVQEKRKKGSATGPQAEHEEQTGDKGTSLQGTSAPDTQDSQRTDTSALVPKERQYTEQRFNGPKERQTVQQQTPHKTKPDQSNIRSNNRAPSKRTSSELQKELSKLDRSRTLDTKTASYTNTHSPPIGFTDRLENVYPTIENRHTIQNDRMVRYSPRERTAAPPLKERQRLEFHQPLNYHSVGPANAALHPSSSDKNVRSIHTVPKAQKMIEALVKPAMNKRQDTAAVMNGSTSSLPSSMAQGADSATLHDVLHSCNSVLSGEDPPIASKRKSFLAEGTVKRFAKSARSQPGPSPGSKPAMIPKARKTAFKSTVKPDSVSTAPATRAARAAHRKMQRKMAAQTKRTAKPTVEAFKKVTQAVVKAGTAVTSAIAGFIGAGILLLSLVVIIVIAAVANSPFGLFFAQEPNAPGTVSVAQAVGSVKMAYNNRLELLQAGAYDDIIVHGQAADWAEVLAVFAVKTAGADIGGVDVATLDPDRVEKLTAVFWDMTAISVEEEVIIHPATDETEEWTETILHVTITPRSADDMRVDYAFTDYQNSALDELLSDRAALSSIAGSLTITDANIRDVLTQLPADLEQARKETVQTALSLVGKVNYFWGGKSHAIGWDSRWGTLQKVWAAGSSTTSTYRPFGLDCSGFIDWVFNNTMGYIIGHGGGVRVQHTYCTNIPQSAAQPGDLAFYPDDSHIGIIVGRNEAGKLLVCHCSSGQNNVVVTEFTASGFTAVGRPNIFNS